MNLRVVEKEDLPLILRWFNDPVFIGSCNPLHAQQSKTEIEKEYDNLGSDEKWFLIEKKDGRKAGFVGTRVVGSWYSLQF